MKQLLLMILIMIPTMTGCAWVEENFEQTIDPRLDHVTIYQRPTLDKARQDVPVYPVSFAQQDLTAVFFPFYVHERSGGSTDTGRKIGHLFWRSWVGEEVFPSISYRDMQDAPGKTAARRMAGEKEADLYVLGQVNHYLYGGSQGSTSIALTINIYCVQTDELVWSMAHSGRIDNARDRDFVLITRRTWMPQSPEYVIVKNLAHDLGQPVKAWTRGTQGSIPSAGPAY